jgi:hypothetical protein
MMTRVMLAVAAILLVIAGWFVFSTMRVSSDPPDVQIQSALSDAATSYNTGRVWDALSIVSSEYKDNTGLTRDQLTALISRYRVEAPDALVTIEKADVQITGDEAVIPMEVSISGPAVRRYSVTLHMKRENVTAYGVIPVKRWRVFRVENMPEMRDMI